MQNKLLLQQTVIVTIPGLDWETQKKSASKMPQTKQALGEPVSCRIDDGKATFASSLDRLLHVQNKKSVKRPKPHDAPLKPPESYAVSMEAMHKMEYPMPVRLQHGNPAAVKKALSDLIFDAYYIIGTWSWK